MLMKDDHRQLLTDAYRDHSDHVLRACLRLAGGHRPWALDRTHDVFLRLYDHLSRRRLDQELRPFLLSQALAACAADLRRREGTSGRLGFGAGRKPAQAEPGSSLTLRRELIPLEVALAQLPVREHLLLALMYLERETLEGAAAKLGLSPAKAEDLEARAVARLQEGEWNTGRVSRRLEAPDEAAARLDAEALGPNERALLWERIQVSANAPRPRRSRAALVGAGAAAVCASAALVYLLGRPPAPPPSPPAAACQLDEARDSFHLPAHCPPERVRVGNDEWTITPGSNVERAAHGARLREGRVRFRIGPRLGSVFRVTLDGGHEIQVVGTEFEVEQRGKAGSVSVAQGIIEFAWADGSRQRVFAGQTLAWDADEKAAPAAGPAPPAAAASAPTLPSPAPPAKPDASAPPDRGTAPAVATAEDVDADPRKPPSTARSKNGSSSTPAADADVVQRVQRLRREGRVGEVITLIARTIADPSVGAAERRQLDYEMGWALEATGRDACDHWSRHVQAYGVDRADTALAERLERCGL